MCYFKKQSFVFLLVVLLSSAAPPNVDSMQKDTAAFQAATASTTSTSSDIMIVDPKEVSKDWKLAFSMLQNKGVGNLVFRLEDGEEISQIDSIDALPGGYLMLLTIKSLHGMQYKIVKTREISSLTTK